MSENLEKKKAIVADLVEKLKESSDQDKAVSTVLFNYSQIEANEMNSLRTAMEEAGAQIKIVKNTLVKRALKTLGISLSEDLEGQNAIVIPTKKDFISPLKELYKFMKETSKGEVVLGILNNEQLPSEKVKQLSTLPSHQELIGQFVSVLSSPIRGFEMALIDTQSKFVRTIQAIKESKS